MPCNGWVAGREGSHRTLRCCMEQPGPCLCPPSFPACRRCCPTLPGNAAAAAAPDPASQLGTRPGASSHEAPPAHLTCRRALHQRAAHGGGGDSEQTTTGCNGRGALYFGAAAACAHPPPRFHNPPPGAPAAAGGSASRLPGVMQLYWLPSSCDCWYGRVFLCVDAVENSRHFLLHISQSHLA